MLSEVDHSRIAQLAERYGARRVILFGSSADAAGEAHDIDLGVEGIRPEVFFRFYGDLIFSVSRPVDLIDLSRETLFTRRVRERGIPLYG